jgi:hypothetical protein
MTCAYHQEYDRAFQACRATAILLLGLNVQPTNFMLGILNAGAAPTVIMLNNLDQMEKAIVAFLNSSNFPERPSDPDAFKAHAQLCSKIRGRRNSPTWRLRLQLLQQLIQVIRGFAATAWPGAGGSWF